MASADRRPASEAPHAAVEDRVAAVLAAGQWVAVGAVVAGFVLGWVFTERLAGLATRLLWMGAAALTAAPLLALLALGLGAGPARRRLAGYALGAIAVAALGALLAR